MAMNTLKAKAQVSMGKDMLASCESRGIELLIDVPTREPGTGIHLNPVESLLNTLGACQLITARSYAGILGIDLQELWIEMEGDLDSAGFKAPDIRSGLQAIRSHIHIKSDSSQEKIEEFINLVEQKCPVADTIRNSAEISSTIILEK